MVCSSDCTSASSPSSRVRKPSCGAVRIVMST
jgi:hypothetical protein